MTATRWLRCLVFGAAVAAAVAVAARSRAPVAGEEARLVVFEAFLAPG